MVTSEELRKWAGEYRIRQKAPSDQWPLAHHMTFEHIRYLSQTNLQDYSACAQRDSNKPWKRYNVNKAAHLSKKSSSLSARSANESAWRHGIEGVIVKRLSDEVACPRCRYRLWRSEIEFGREGTTPTDLGSHVHDREVCECPAEHRPRDPYEIETSPVFEELIEGDVVHDDPGRLRLTQKPDRIIGLKETENMTRLLDQPPQAHVKQHVSRIRTLIQMTPSRNRSKQQSKPLLLPFLVIEAKSHKAQESFADIQTQTALPIRSFLNSQWDLWKHGSSHCPMPEPLVWFLAYRGSDWKLYACYRNRDCTSDTAYIIHHLQSGDLMTQEGALHLILIFDYIADWAKESYRPSVLKQLTSMATGKDFDKIILETDPDVVSDSKSVALWAATTKPDIHMDETAEESDSESVHAEEHSNVNFLHMPTSDYGSIRPMNTAVFRCTGLRITGGNIADFLRPGLSDQTNGACARELLHQITRWEDILVITAADLGDLEFLWNGGEPSSFSHNEKLNSEFYVKLQYRCFVDLSWRTIRELSYLAISPSALPELMRLAASQRKIPGLHSLPERLCRCSGATLQETIDCIRGGSQWQVLRSALACTAFYLHPCLAASDNSTQRVAYFTLGHVRSTRFSALIEILGREFSSRHDCSAICSVWRSVDNKVWIENEPHDDFSCSRCSASGQNIFALPDCDDNRLPFRSTSGAILVSALRQTAVGQELQDRHQLCLYLFEKSPALVEGVSFSTIIEESVRSERIYHTILHGQSTGDTGSDAVLWNMPRPYRPSTRKQQHDVARWVHDLTEFGSSFDQNPPLVSMHIWVHQQILLYFLRQRMTYDDAMAAVRAFRNESRAVYRRQQNLPDDDTNLPLSCVELSKFWAEVYRERDNYGDSCE